MLLSKNFTRSHSQAPKKITKKVRFLDDSHKPEKLTLRKSMTLFPPTSAKNPKKMKINETKKFVIRKRINISRSPKNENKINSPGSFSSVSRFKLLSPPQVNSLKALTPIIIKKRSKFSKKSITSKKYKIQISKDPEENDGTIIQDIRKARTPVLGGSSRGGNHRPFYTRSFNGDTSSRHRSREIYEQLISKEKENRKKNANKFFKKNSLKLKKIKGILKNKNNDFTKSVQFYSQANSIQDESSEKEDNNTPPEVKNHKSVFFKIRETPLRKNTLSFAFPKKIEQKKQRIFGKNEFEKAERHSMEFALIALKDILTKAVKLNEKDHKEENVDRLSTIFSPSSIRKNDEHKALLFVKIHFNHI